MNTENINLVDQNIVAIPKRKVKPFLKWAGGKTQLLPFLTKALPEEIYKEKIIYVEPFIGSGALFFWVLNYIPNAKKFIINDINKDLINTYKAIKDDVYTLVSILKKWEKEYHNLERFPLEKKKYYLEKRKFFNLKSTDKTHQAALFIFLNRTCFNGLYRVNKSGEFNVPMGRYKRPLICDEENLINISNSLKDVEILSEDFENILTYVKERAFFYFDPPYKPLNHTSNFTSYHNEGFSDKDQIRLKNFCDKISKMGHLWMLSNSDAKEKGEGFFDRLYKDYYILRIPARRSINSDPKKRGKISELLITNYKNPLKGFIDERDYL